MSRIKDKMIRNYLESNQSLTTKFVLENREKLGMAIDIKPIEKLAEELEGLSPMQVIKKIALGDFSLSYPYFFQDGDGYIHSADRSRAWIKIRNQMDMLVARIQEIQVEEIFPSIIPIIQTADQIDKEIKEQKERIRKQTTEINVPQSVEGSYDDYTEVRGTVVPPWMTIA